jgi:hypothetical protein
LRLWWWLQAFQVLQKYYDVIFILHFLRRGNSSRNLWSEGFEVATIVLSLFHFRRHRFRRFLEEIRATMSTQGGSEEQLTPYNMADIGSTLPTGSTRKLCVLNYLHSR